MDRTAARYELRAFSSRPTPARFTHGRPVGGVPQPAAARTRQCARVPANARFLALRAVDHAGLVSLPATVSVLGRGARLPSVSVRFTG